MSRKHKLILFASAALAMAVLTLVSFRLKKNAPPVAIPSEPAALSTQDSTAGISKASLPANVPSVNTPAPTIAGNQTSPPRVIPLHLEEFDQRILLAPKEIVTLQIDGATAGAGTLRIDAPNGGSINGRKAPAIVEASEAARGLQFTVGPTRGLYTLEVSRGGATRIFEFWVDRESPGGQPGPDRTFIR